MNDYEKKVARLEREVDKYQTLAAIEELTRKAKRDLDTSPISPSCDLKSFLSSTSQISESLIPRSRYCQTDQVYYSSSYVQTDSRTVKDSASSPIKELLPTFNQKPIKPLVQPVSPIPQQTGEPTVKQAVVKPLSSEEISEVSGKSTEVVANGLQDVSIPASRSAPSITVIPGILYICIYLLMLFYCL